MKNLKLKFIALLILAAGIGAACSVDDKDNYCFSSAYVPISAVTGPTTTKINVPITFNVSYLPGGTCGKLNHIVESKPTTDEPLKRNITVLVDYVGCQCPATDKALTDPYTFTASAAGTYELKFSTSDVKVPIVKTITVTE